MQDKYHLTQQSLKSILSQLPEKQFLRIHKSYIISLTKINHFSHKEVNLENVTLPIGRTYLKGFLEKINS
jgi:DNA-binding LytR/AlgR family response regulator